MARRKKCEMISEAYEKSKINIEYSILNDNTKSILFVSNNDNEGRIDICTNIALSFSKANKKIILIDMDFRNPGIHKIFNIKNQEGFIDVLEARKSISSVIYSYNKNLDILTSGMMQNNYLEYIYSDIFKHTIDLLEDKYDYLLFNASAMSLYTDAQILASKLDKTIIVVKINETKMESISKIKQNLKKVRANIIGAIVNK